MEELLTHDELVVLGLLRQVTKKFVELPEHHPTDCLDWTAQIHALQNQVMSRAAIRYLPEMFTPMQTEEERRHYAYTSVEGS